MSQLSGLPLSIAFAFIAISVLTPRFLALVHKWQTADAEFSKKLASHHSDVIEVSKESDFPDSWYTSEVLFSLEARSIFSKSWLCTVHISMLPNAGDYRTMTLPGGFPIIVSRGKDRQIRIIYNVCRHRAYAVATKPKGRTLVFGCRYHGWSYDTKGKLVKAPKFDGVDGFDPTANGLFELRAVIDENGFVLVRLDGDEAAPPPKLLVSEELVVPTCVEEWSLEGAFNWKIIGT